MSYNILVIDDSSALRKVLIKTIRMCRIGETIFWQADNGKNALEILDEEWIDAIFTDINMPVMDGIQLIGELKKRNNFEQVPIIVVTSEARAKAKEKFCTLGADEVVSKPFKPEEIYQALAQLLPVDQEQEDDDDDEGFDF